MIIQFYDVHQTIKIPMIKLSDYLYKNNLKLKENNYSNSSINIRNFK